MGDFADDMAASGDPDALRHTGRRSVDWRSEEERLRAAIFEFVSPDAELDPLKHAALIKLRDAALIDPESEKSRPQKWCPTCNSSPDLPWFSPSRNKVASDYAVLADPDDDDWVRCLDPFHAPVPPVAAESRCGWAAGPKDPVGCVLPEGHEGKHRFNPVVAEKESRTDG